MGRRPSSTDDLHIQGLAPNSHLDPAHIASSGAANGHRLWPARCPRYHSRGKKVGLRLSPASASPPLSCMPPLLSSSFWDHPQFPFFFQVCTQPCPKELLSWEAGQGQRLRGWLPDQGKPCSAPQLQGNALLLHTSGSQPISLPLSWLICNNVLSTVSGSSVKQSIAPQSLTITSFSLK